MAMPIEPTPVLDEEEYSEFWDKVKQEESHKAPLRPTPGLEELRRQILEDARRR